MDPILELQGAIVARLKATAAVTALIGQRVFDLVPIDADGRVTARFPYVSLGSASALQSDADCIEAEEVMFRVDAWSREPGYPEVMGIAHAVKRALHKQELALSMNALVEIQHRRTDRMRDPDGLTSHAVIEFTATIETP